MDKAYNMTSFNIKKEKNKHPGMFYSLHETQDTQVVGVPILMTDFDS